MSVVTRFPPSPTGTLHIGSARTALFNWLFARHHGGLFLLRIEDTDRARSTPEAVQAIIEGLRWLKLDWDGDIVFQFARAVRHQQVAYELLDAGKAYRCFCTVQALEAMREDARAKGRPPRYNGQCRVQNEHYDPTHHENRPFVIRLKTPQTGETILQDCVQGSVTVQNQQLDDMVLLRADGTPTYMLSVVVDDHDMGVTHVIRGDDHLTNAFRQAHIYQACGWTLPVFGHIPLIHGADGAKLSKRHGAIGVEAYREMGFLPEALCNYLSRLGWSHGDDEIFSREQAIAWFDGTSIGRGSARFDLPKLRSLNAHYIQTLADEGLVDQIQPFLEKIFKDKAINCSITEQHRALLLRGMADLKKRAKTLEELAEQAVFYCYKGSVPLSPEGRALLQEGGNEHLKEIYPVLEGLGLDFWTHASIQEILKSYAIAKHLKLAQVAQPLRVALTGSTVSPGVFEIMEILGKEESLLRIQRGHIYNSPI